MQVSLALPPPAPQGQSTAPCLHCWQVSKSLAASCSCARHRDRGKGRNDCLQPGTHKQFKLKGPLFELREDLKVPPLRYHQSVTASLFSAEFIGSSLFYFVWLIRQPASSTFTLQVLFKETDVWKLLNECLSAFYQLLMLHSSRYITKIWIHHSLFVAVMSAPPIWKNLPVFSRFCSSTVEHFETEYIKKKKLQKTLEFLRKAINSGSWTVKYNHYLPQTRGGETYLTLWFRFRSSEHR